MILLLWRRTCNNHMFWTTALARWNWKTYRRENLVMMLTGFQEPKLRNKVNSIVIHSCSNKLVTMR
jgi:hypothetical protein